MTTTNRLSERAMLIHLSTHEWTGKTKDKRVSQDASRRENADKDVIEAIINLAPPGELKPISVARGRVYRRFCELTLPWLDGALRILPSAMFMDFRKEMNEVITFHTEAVTIFAGRWPDIVANKGKRLGKLAGRYKLPGVDEIKRRFYIHMDILPMPEAVDFRAKVGDDEIAEVKKQVEKSLGIASTKAMSEVWSRLAELVANVAETMGQPKKRFNDSLIKKLKTFAEMLPKYNITDNTDLDNIRKEVINKLAGLDPEDLREIPNKRKAANKDAKDILEKIAQYTK